MHTEGLQNGLNKTLWFALSQMFTLCIYSKSTRLKKYFYTFTCIQWKEYWKNYTMLASAFKYGSLHWLPHFSQRADNLRSKWLSDMDVILLDVGLPSDVPDQGNLASFSSMNAPVLGEWCKSLNGWLSDSFSHFPWGEIFWKASVQNWGPHPWTETLSLLWHFSVIVF